MTQSSWFGADGHSRFQVLWQDGDRVFCRRVDGERDVLAVLLAAEHPAPAALDRLAHEYSLKDELDGAWAVRPLALERDRGRTILVLEDPGGEPLGRLLGAPFELGRFLRLAIGIAAALGKAHQRGLVHKDLKPAHILVNRATECFFCKNGFFSGCERSNPNHKMAEKLWGHSPAGLFGYSHMLGGFAGGQAEYLRVPYADVGPIKVPQGLSDEQVLFLSDIFPTGFMAAEFCNLKGGETVAVWGSGPVGQFAIKSAFLLGAERVIAIDTVPERLALAEASGAMTLDFKKVDIYDRIQDLTNGRGADACIDAVGTEPDTGSGFDAVLDRVKVATFMGTDRPHVLRQAIHCCRNFGTVSIVGVYGGLLDKIPMGSAINRGLTFRMAQTPVQHYLPQLLERIEKGEIDPSFVITHRATLEEGPELYKTFRAKQEGCIKVIMKP